MWIMGVSTAISTRSKLRNSIPRPTICWGVCKRSSILFFLGLIINSLGGNNDLKTLRIPGVLQRFAVCYLVVGTMEALLMKREEEYQVFLMNSLCLKKLKNLEQISQGKPDSNRIFFLVFRLHS